MPTDSAYGGVVRLSSRRAHRAPGLSAPRPVAQKVPPRIGGTSLQEALPGRPFDPSATALILAALQDARAPVLWVKDRASQRENGRLYTAGLRRMGVMAPVLHVDVNHPRDVFWAMEEGASCGGLSAVVGEIHGAPAILDFTATKRLVLRADASGVPVWLIRSGDPGTLTAARERWRVSALPSECHLFDPRAPGAPVWEADLFRTRGRPPGRWEVRHDPDAVPAGAADRLRLVPRAGDREVAGDPASHPHVARG